MRSRLVQLLVMLSMLSACAGTSDRPHAPTWADDTADHIEDGDRHVVAPSSSLHRRTYHQPVRHHNDEPSPDDYYAGQIALLLSAQVFACAFFVVILDGSCSFYASTGYYY